MYWRANSEKTIMPANAFCIGGHISVPLKITDRLANLNNLASNNKIIKL